MANGDLDAPVQVTFTGALAPGRNVPQPIRILSIDGGGIRGIIPAMVLAELERKTGRPICKLFDLIAGPRPVGSSRSHSPNPTPPAAPSFRRLA